MAYQNQLWNRYKSKGESKIASYLEKRNFDFTYEKPVAVIDSGKTKIWYPDFYLDNYHILIEYLGMNSNPHYARLNRHKREVYRQNRFDVVEIYPDDFTGNWQRTIDDGIYNTLEDRLSDFLSGNYRSLKHKSYQRQFKFDY